MRKIYIDSAWKDLTDTPEEFKDALTKAVSVKERHFFETMMKKELHELAASNEVLITDEENPDGVYLLRVGNDGYMFGNRKDELAGMSNPTEYAGLFSFLDDDLHKYLYRHTTGLQWLRERNFEVRYDRNNDLI